MFASGREVCVYSSRFAPVWLTTTVHVTTVNVPVDSPGLLHALAAHLQVSGLTGFGLVQNCYLINFIAD